MKAKRPWSVTWLAIGVLMLTIMHATRSIAAIREWDFLASQPLSVSPAYLAGSGLLWSLIGLGLSSGLWLGKAWSRRAMAAISVAYTLYYWIDRLFLASSGPGQRNLPFAVGLNVLSLGIIFWIISRPKARAFFGEMDE